MYEKRFVNGSPSKNQLITYKRGKKSRLQEICRLEFVIWWLGYDSEMDQTTKDELNALLKGYFCGAGCRKK